MNAMIMPLGVPDLIWLLIFLNWHLRQLPQQVKIFLACIQFQLLSKCAHMKDQKTLNDISLCIQSYNQCANLQEKPRNRLVDRQIGRHLSYRWVDGSTDGSRDGSTEGSADGLIEGSSDGSTGGSTERSIDGKRRLD